jgi:hypothetical protein
VAAAVGNLEQCRLLVAAGGARILELEIWHKACHYNLLTVCSTQRSITLLCALLLQTASSCYWRTALLLTQQPSLMASPALSCYY